MSGTNPVGDLLGKIDGLLGEVAKGAEGLAGEAAGAAKGSGLFGRLGGLLGGSIGQLFVWEVLGTILSSLMAPGLELLRQGMFEAMPVVALSPAELSTAVVRNFMHPDQAAAEALKSGVDGARFQTLIANSGLALAPQELATAKRRGLFGDQAVNPHGKTFEDGIREGDLKDYWGPFVEALAHVWPSPVDIIDALVQGQVPGATTSEQIAEGRRLFEKTGGDLQFFDLLFHRAGASPTPDQAALMARRGIIPWDGLGAEATTYAQAFKETRYRDKWSDAFKRAAEYIPPPRTIEAMLRAGAITEAEAVKLLHEAGMHPDIIAATIAEASHNKTKAHKDITVAQVLDMYGAGYLAADPTRGMLEASGYSAKDADELMAYKLLQRAMKQATFAIDKVRGQYVAHKISKETARGALGGLGVPSSEVETILADWSTAEAANVKTLTAAQIADSWVLKILTQDQAEAELVNIGYTPLDAWVILSIKNKQPLPGKPGPTPNAIT